MVSASFSMEVVSSTENCSNVEDVVAVGVVGAVVVVGTVVVGGDVSNDTEEVDVDEFEDIPEEILKKLDLR